MGKDPTRTTLVVGAGGRLGGFIVRELVARGGRVAGLSRNPESVRRIDPGVRALSGSASRAADLRRAARELAEARWRLDSMVICVGGWWQGALLSVPPGEFRALFDSHLAAHFLALRQFAPALIAAPDGACVLTGGIGTEQIVPGSAPISVFGAAQRALVHAVRAEAGERLRCHEVAIMGPLSQDERNEEGEAPVPGEVAAAAVADALAGRWRSHAVVHVGPDGPLD